MGHHNNNKMRLLNIMRILQRESDELHTITLNEISERLMRYGMNFDRKSFYTDIETLREYGMDIVLTKGNHFGYFWANRLFELAEVKLLMDAVQSARFLTEKKSSQLIGKLETLTSSHEAKSLRRQIAIDGRIKAQNESVYYAVDRLHEAIAKNEQVSFKYYEYTLTKTMRYRRNGHIYKVSPYMLHWDGNKYYLIAHYPEHGLTHFRVDKITEIESLEDPFFAPDDDLNLVNYVQQIFSMFGGSVEKVALRIENDLIGPVIDQFGKDIAVQKSGEDHFTTEVSVNVSPSFFSWIFQFGGKAVITGPDSVVVQMRQLMQQQCQAYQVDENMSPRL